MLWAARWMTVSISKSPRMRSSRAWPRTSPRTTLFWDELTAVGLRQLEGSGFENFKRTVNMAYFNWSVQGILRHQFLPVFAQWCRRPRWQGFTAGFPANRSERPGARSDHSISKFRARLRDVASFNAFGAFVYKTYVAMLWESVFERDALGLLSSPDEPTFGNPFLIEYRG